MSSAGSQRLTVMTMIDLRPAARRMAEVVRAIPDDRLGGPTPCPDYRVGDLLEHVGGLALAFGAAAVKETGGATAQSPAGDASRLGDDWRTRIPPDLVALAEAWRDPEAWTGMTEAGGISLPGEVAGLVALDELVIHGWDLARAAGLPYECDQESLEHVHRFVSQFATPEERAGNELFGPVVPVPDDAPLLDRVVGLSGRDPGWSPDRSYGL
jgi:uncharacterized protein (TIGR03086 family)